MGKFRDLDKSCAGMIAKMSCHLAMTRSMAIAAKLFPNVRSHSLIEFALEKAIAANLTTLIIKGEQLLLFLVVIS